VCTLDAFERFPKRLWNHIGEQINADPPGIGTLRALYTERVRTIANHQKLACEALGFQQMTEHQRRAPRQRPRSPTPRRGFASLPRQCAACPPTPS
jgi:hypothetical protein